MPSVNDLLIEELDMNDVEQVSRLQDFCDQCLALGIVNNSSFAYLKLDMLQTLRAKMWLVSDAGRGGAVVGTAGSHHLPEVDPLCYRLLFRGCILPEYRAIGASGLSANHLNSYLFKFVTPLQLAWAKRQGGQRFVITTNVDYKSTGTSPTDRIFHLLEKRGVVRPLHKNVDLYHTLQNIWQINTDFFENIGLLNPPPTP